MNNQIIEKVEGLEDRIENIKWLISRYLPFIKSPVSYHINIVKKTAGILGKEHLKGITFENKVRREWKTNFLKRIKSF